MNAHALRNDAAYAVWAHDYPPLPHNPLMRAEQACLLGLLPPMHGRRALDLACGTGRYGRLFSRSGAEVVGLDSSEAMLVRADLRKRVRADMARLPFGPGCFDLVVCGLAVGHVADLDAWWHEVARVLAPGGWLLVSDFHPDAARAGMKRCFTDAAGTRHDLLHSLFDVADHERAAAQAGLQIRGARTVRAGIELDETFDGSAAFYARWSGLPVVLALAAQKP